MEGPEPTSDPTGNWSFSGQDTQSDSSLFGRVFGKSSLHSFVTATPTTRLVCAESRYARREGPAESLTGGLSPESFLQKVTPCKYQPFFFTEGFPEVQG